MVRWASFRNFLSPKNSPFRRNRPSRRPPLRGSSLLLEPLEDRVLLSTYIVQGPNDGIGSITATGDPTTFNASTLRAAIDAANAAGGLNTIEFNASMASGQIMLSQNDTNNPYAFGPTAFVITDPDLKIIGNLSGTPIDIMGDGGRRLFAVTSGASLTLQYVTLSGGVAAGGAGGTAAGDAGGGGGAAGLGGAIFNQGTVTILQSALTGNTAQGGAGGANLYDTPRRGGGGGGGGLGGAGGAGYATGSLSYSFGGGGAGLSSGGGSATSSGGGFGGAGGTGGTAGSGSEGGLVRGAGGGGGGAGGSGVSGAGGHGGFGGGGGGASASTTDSDGGAGGFAGGGGGASSDTVSSAGGNGGFGGGGGGGARYNSGLTSTGGTGGFGGGNGSAGATSYGGGGGGGAGMGGAIFNDVGGTLTISDSTLTGNSAVGGQGGTPGDDGAGNPGKGLGGAIFNYAGSVTLVNATISGNTGLTPVKNGYSLGGTIFNLAARASQQAQLTLENSIVAYSIVNAAKYTYSDSAIENVQLAGQATVTASAPNMVTSLDNNGGSVDRSGLLDVSVSLEALGNAGGPTVALVPKPTSGVIGVGSVSDAPGPTDQRGFPRITNGLIDLGAVQTQSGTLQLTPSNNLTTPLAPAVLGQTYSQTFTAFAGSGTYQFSTSATPPGLTFTQSGASYTLSGVPTQIGVSTFTISVTDSAGNSASYTYSLKVAAAPLSLTAAGVPNYPGIALNAIIAPATSGSSYSQTFTAAGGVPTYSFTLPWSGTGGGNGGIPGLAFAQQGNDLVLSGTPTASGSYSFVITVTDTAGAQLTQQYTMSVAASGAVYLNPNSGTDLPIATVGSSFSLPFNAVGGDTGTFAFTAAVNGVPVSSVDGLGVSTSPTAVTFAGVPTAAGAFPITITATATHTFTGDLTSGDTVVRNVSSFANLVVGQPISGLGIAPGTTIAALDSSNNRLTLSTAATATRSGDALAATGIYGFAGDTTAGSTTITNVSDTTGLQVGQTVSGGGFPPGVTIQSISDNTVTVNLAATTTATAPLVAAFTTTQAYTLSVNPSSLTLAPLALQPGTAGLLYVSEIPSTAASSNEWPNSPFLLSATGGSGTGYVYSATGLPPGLILSSSGFITGIPAVAGTYSVTITVTDSAGNHLTRTYPLTILPGISDSASFQADTTAGSTTIHITNKNGTLAVGQMITGYGIPAGTVVTQVSGSTVTLSSPAVVTASGFTLYSYGIGFTGSTTAGSPVISNLSSFANLSGLAIGQTVSGAGIPSGATIVAINGTSLTLSAPALSTATSTFSAASGGYYTPQQILQAYGINSIVLNGGVLGTGFGTTIAILESDGDPQFVSSTLPGYDSSDLHFFNQTFGIKDFASDPTQGPIFLRLNGNGAGASQFTADVTAGSATITNVSAVGGLYVGQVVSGTGIPSGTTIQSISGTSVTLSANATTNGTGVWLMADLYAVEASGIGEEQQDAMWAHALAPDANILIFEYGSSAYVTGSTLQNSPVITGLSTAAMANVAVGDSVYGDGIPSNAIIVGVDRTYNTITLNTPATHSHASDSIEIVSTAASAMNQIKNWSTANNPVGIILPSTITGSTNLGIPGISAVSSSFSGYEYVGSPGETQQDYHYDVPGVTLVEAVGDRAIFGSRSGTNYPPTSPFALSAAMSQLLTDSQGNWLAEMGYINAGGGISLFEPIPSYQSGITTAYSITNRATPDVAFIGAGNSPAVALQSNDGNPLNDDANGSSLAAPSWTALLAILNQQLALTGQSTNSATQLLTKIYNTPASYFHQISFMNDGTSLTPNYNLFTGRGSPIANALIPYLAGGVNAISGSVTVGGVPQMGVTIFLDANNNGIPDPNEAQTVTDASGAFRFPYVAIGTYRVREVLPAGQGAASGALFVVSFSGNGGAQTVLFQNFFPVPAPTPNPLLGTLLIIADNNVIYDLSLNVTPPVTVPTTSEPPPPIADVPLVMTPTATRPQDPGHHQESGPDLSQLIDIPQEPERGVPPPGEMKNGEALAREIPQGSLPLPTMFADFVPSTQPWQVSRSDVLVLAEEGEAWSAPTPMLAASIAEAPVPLDGRAALAMLTLVGWHADAGLRPARRSREGSACVYN